MITIFPTYAEELEPSSKRNTNGTTFAGFWLLDEYQMITAFHVHTHRSETAIEVDILAAIVTELSELGPTGLTVGTAGTR